MPQDHGDSALVTPGLCVQRELDPVRLGDHRVALIEELRAERDATQKVALPAAQEAGGGGEPELI